MRANKSSKYRALFVGVVFCSVLILLCGRVFYIQTNGDYLQKLAYEQQTRDRLIASQRGEILDRNGTVLATNNPVSTISVVNAEIENYEETAKVLSEKLDVDYEDTLKKCKEKVALSRIKTKVDKDVAEEIRNLDIKGVKIDEDVKRIYPYSNLASQVIGFVGKDNQGIIGLEAKYDEYLKGKAGKILSEADGQGRAFENSKDERQPPVDGYNLVTTIDLPLQSYVEQTLESAMIRTQAKRGLIIVMDATNGEIISFANNPNFDLNKPFEINKEEIKENWDFLDQKTQNELLNNMWRNFGINDTYEPGSTFKVFTSVVGLELGLVDDNSSYVCTGSRQVGNRRIKCWRSSRPHGVLNFVEGVKNSCNPVFMTIGEQIGSDKFYEYLKKYNLMGKTGVDLAGEGQGIFHPLKNVGPVELATMSFGQSFQITPLALITFVAESVNGGYKITPHFAKELVTDEKEVVGQYEYGEKEQLISKKTSLKMRDTLEQVVATGTANKIYIEGERIGAKTATSEKLPRGNGKYIASMVAFTPADKPKYIVLTLIDEPVGAYYGGVVCSPIMKEVMEKIVTMD